MKIFERIAEAHTLISNAWVASDAAISLSLHGLDRMAIERLIGLAQDQAERARDLLQPIVDEEVAL